MCICLAVKGHLLFETLCSPSIRFGSVVFWFWYNLIGVFGPSNHSTEAPVVQKSTNWGVGRGGGGGGI